MTRFPPPATALNLQFPRSIIQHCLGNGWKYIPEWPYRIEDLGISISGKLIRWSCQRCQAKFTLFWADDRIWKMIDKSWWSSIICPDCLVHLADNPQEVRAKKG